MRLYSKRSERLYLNEVERQHFERVAHDQTIETKLLCLILLYTGCRITEALNLRKEDVQSEVDMLSITSLKKRQKHLVRELVVPKPIIVMIAERSDQIKGNEHLLSYSRSTAWRSIKAVMDEAQIQGKHATPKGLRHSFGVHCALNNIPMSLAQKWLGHADIRTTAIYYQIVGKEERAMAERLW